jgi:hypothetical protein
MLTTSFTLPPLTVDMDIAQADLTKLDLVKIPLDPSRVPKTAQEAWDVLDTFGHNLVSHRIFFGLLSNNYHRQMAGIKAVNAAIQAHNDQVDQEIENRRIAELNDLLKRVSDTLVPSYAYRPTGSARPAWLDDAPTVFYGDPEDCPVRHR